MDVSLGVWGLFLVTFFFQKTCFGIIWHIFFVFFGIIWHGLFVFQYSGYVLLAFVKSVLYIAAL